MVAAAGQASAYAPLSDDPILACYARAQIDYCDHFVRLYIAYNAWYREVTGAINDREALVKLKQRVVIWDDFLQGKTMADLRQYMEELANFTHAQPLGATQHWQGRIDDAKDWPSLIEYWYQVRCMLVHGTAIDERYAWFAYRTLNIFMTEIVERVQQQLTSYASLVAAAEAPDSSFSSPRFTKLRRKLYEKYTTSSDIWQVDMKRVQ